MPVSVEKVAHRDLRPQRGSAQPGIKTAKFPRDALLGDLRVEAFHFDAEVARQSHLNGLWKIDPQHSCPAHHWLTSKGGTGDGEERGACSNTAEHGEGQSGDRE